MCSVAGGRNSDPYPSGDDPCASMAFPKSKLYFFRIMKFFSAASDVSAAYDAAAVYDDAAIKENQLKTAKISRQILGKIIIEKVNKKLKQ